MDAWRILAVDDDKEALAIIERALASRYEVAVCDSGRQALDQIEIIQPDIVVLDVVMPGDLDGYEICRRLRGNREFSQTPIVFLSALDGVDDMKKAYAQGANLYLTKPIDPQRLVRNIDVFIERTPPAFRHKSMTIEEVAEKIDGYTGPASDAPSPDQPAGAAEATASADTSKAQPSSAQESAGGADSALPRALFVFEDSQRLGRMAGPCEGRLEFVWSLNGREALDRLAIYEPDVVVLEESLPGLDGLALTRAIREDAQFHATPVVFCSLQDTASERDGARRAGATVCLRLTDDHAAVVNEVVAQTADQPPRRKKISIQEALDILEFGIDGADAPEDDEI